MNYNTLSLPMVSIVITTYNRAQLLTRAIDSAVNQSYPNIEIVIVNDGSNDQTDTIVQKYVKNLKNVKYVRHETTLGGNAARNSGIKVATGEYIAGLDDDDEFLPNRISILMNNYKSRYSLISSRSVQIGKSYKVKTKFLPYVDLDIMLFFNAIGNQVLVKKKLLVDVGLFDEKFIRCQDYDMWLRIIAKHGRARILNDITQIIHYEHDGHSNNSTTNDFKGAFMFYKKHKGRMNNLQRRISLYKIKRLQQKKILYVRVKDLLISIVINFACYSKLIKALVSETSQIYNRKRS